MYIGEVIFLSIQLVEKDFQMKRISALLLTVGMALCFFTPAFSAEEFTYEEGKVDLVCPDGWKHEISEEALTMGSPDGAVQFVFELVEAKDLESGLAAAKKEIDEAIGPTTFAEPVEEKLNGMDAVTFEGTNAAKGLEVMVSLIITPAENVLCTYYFASKAAEEQHAAGIAEVIKGIRPATAAAAPQTPAGAAASEAGAAADEANEESEDAGE